MVRRYVFADEAGDFVFKRSARNSKYFIVCTVWLDSCKVGADLLELRRRLAWEGFQLNDFFHATEDKQAVRDEVFNLIRSEDFRVQATVMEKSKAQPQVALSKDRFYKYGWFYHLKFIGHKIVAPDLELLFTTASIGTKQGQAIFTESVNDAVQQTIKRNQWKTYFCQSSVDPCLQIADYCTWAIQRKWERGDTRSYDLIRDHIDHEFDMWSKGTTHYY